MTTSSLNITKITRHTATTKAPRTIILITTPTDDLNVAVVTLYENTGLGDGVVIGDIDNDDGTCDAQLSTSVFEPIWVWAGSVHLNPAVSLKYDDDGDGDLDVTQVSVNSSSIVVSLESHAQIVATLEVGARPAAE